MNARDRFHCAVGWRGHARCTGTLLVAVLALASAGCVTVAPETLKWRPSADTLPTAAKTAPAALVDHSLLLPAVFQVPHAPGGRGLAIGKPSADYFIDTYSRHFDAVAPRGSAAALSEAFADAPIVRATFEGGSLVTEYGPEIAGQALMVLHYRFALSDRADREMAAWRVTGRSAHPPLPGFAWDGRTRELATSTTSDHACTFMPCQDYVRTVHELATNAIEDAGRQLVELLRQEPAGVGRSPGPQIHDHAAAIRIDARARTVGSRPSSLPPLDWTPVVREIQAIDLRVHNESDRPLDFDPATVAWHRPVAPSVGTLPSSFVARVLVPASGSGPHARSAKAMLYGAGSLFQLVVGLAATGITEVAEHVDHQTHADAIDAFRSAVHAGVLGPATIGPGAALAGRVYMHRPADETASEIVVALVDRERLRRYTFVVPVADATAQARARP